MSPRRRVAGGVGPVLGPVSRARMSHAGIDYERIGGQLGAARAGLSLAAPLIAAKPKRLSKLTGNRPSSFGKLSS
jgi:hypothetical protein